MQENEEKKVDAPEKTQDTSEGAAKVSPPKENKGPAKDIPAKKLSPRQVKQGKKLLVYLAMSLIFAGAMFLIFGSSSKDGAQTAGADGLNAEIPVPSRDGIIGDKLNAYEMSEVGKNKREQTRSLEDFIIPTDSNNTKPTIGAFDDVNDTQQQPPSAIRSSVTAYQNMNRELNSFGTAQTDDKEQEILALEWRIQELEKSQEENSRLNRETKQQEELMEKSYRMAAKYIPNMQQGAQSSGQASMPQVTPTGSITTTPKPQSVTTVREQTVSALAPEMSDSAFIADYSQPRNYGFNTAVGSGYSGPRNTIKACIHEEQSVMDGQPVRLRLQEPLQAGELVIPRHTLLVGAVKIQGERLDITVSSIEHAGNIIPVELKVYDTDGQPGICIPTSLEREAMNEAMANIGSGLGSSISFAQSSGQQITMDVTRGLMQGASGYLGKKFRTVKVHLKAGHQVLLYAKKK
nr:conjugative transposon protein TraM [Bacteroides intestinalis]